MAITFTTERRDNPFGGWSRNAEVGGVEYQCRVTRGKSVRIPYRRKRGWQWHGSVYQRGGGCLWDGRVPGSIGVRGLLTLAGVVASQEPANSILEASR